MTEAAERGDRSLTWVNFQRLIDEGEPALQPVPDLPGVEFFVEERARRVGLYARAQELTALPALDYAQVELAWVERNGNPYLEVATDSRELFREFFSFLLAIAETIRVTQAPPVIAVTESLSRWKQLLAPLQLLSSDVQIGLLGELWLLHRLLSHSGPTALDAWIGPRGELHDFRIAGSDIEVKTTRLNRRVHIITSLNQLEVERARPLLLLSIHLSAAGAAEGFSIVGLIARIREMFGGDAQRREAFDALLNKGVGYREAQSSHYAEESVMRAPARLVPVDERFPRITPELLGRLPAEARVRIDEVRYRINVEGLGHQDGDPEFDAVVP
jgi:hypothetical protein